MVGVRSEVRNMQITLYFDGAAEPTNPGRGSCGFIVFADGRELHHETVDLGDGITNNVAEHYGLIYGFRYLLDNELEEFPCHIVGDSMLVLNQIFGRWRCKARHLKPLVAESKEYKFKFKNITWAWIKGLNNPADKYSRIDLTAVIKNG